MTDHAYLSGIIYEKILIREKIPYKKSKTNIFTILCIHHKERNPSMKLYPDGRCFCYGCHYEVDIYDFARKFGYTADEIAENHLRNNDINQLVFSFVL